MSDQPAPLTVRVLMYQMGVGDCFLVSIEYDRALPDGRDHRYVLIDFGSFKTPRTSFAETAALIASHCRGKLDVVVVSHRDKDHIAGFADPEAARVLRTLSPGLVVRPWTDDPGMGLSLRGSSRVADRASANLHAMTPEGRVVYLEPGRAAIVEQALPGTEVFLLGPPGRDAWRSGIASVNDTSLILSLTVNRGRRSKRLLFPGDAEAFSWSQALRSRAFAELIQKVDLYKIGHHGSVGASPPELLNIWKRSRRRPRVGLLSTQAGVFGNAAMMTELPSRRLLRELRKLMRIVTTQDCRTLAFVEVAARVSSRATFAIEPARRASSKRLLNPPPHPREPTEPA